MCLQWTLFLTQRPFSAGGHWLKRDLNSLQEEKYVPGIETKSSLPTREAPGPHGRWLLWAWLEASLDRTRGRWCLPYFLASSPLCPFSQPRPPRCSRQLPLPDMTMISTLVTEASFGFCLQMGASLAKPWVFALAYARFLCHPFCSSQFTDHLCGFSPKGLAVMWESVCWALSSSLFSPRWP